MHFSVFYFSFLIMIGTYAYTFKEDFTKEILNKMFAVALVVTVFVLLFCVIL